MNSNEYREFLLRNMYGAKPAAGGREVVCKCHYCPDDGDHYHMNISIPQSEGELSYFNCFKCHTGGAVTYRRLIQWGIIDPEWNEILTNHNRVAAGLNPAAANELEDFIFNTQPYNALTEVSLLKMKYINDRLGTNLTIQDAIDNNIILDLGYTLNSNRIYKYTRDIRVMQALSDNFLGFLSYDRNFVNLRRLIPEGNMHESVDKKYINYNIRGRKNNTLKFIMFPTYLNLYELIKVHIAEGPFDALSIKYNLRGNQPNDLYCAVTGNAYKGLIKYLITGLGIMNMELHLYIDSDNAGIYFLKDLLESLSMYRDPIYIHRNQIGKDMGVRPEEIQESIERIK